MTVSTITVGPGKLTLGAQAAIMNLQSQVTECALVPSVKKDEPITVLSGEQVAGARTETWTLEGKHLQDLGALQSVSEYLYAHSGEEVPFEFTPSSAVGKKINGVVSLDATKIGGEVTKKPDAEFKFDIIGKPVISEAAAPPAGA